MRVLYLSHTARIAGAEHALLGLLARLPDDVSPYVACPEGPLAEAVRTLGLPWFDVSGTDVSLRLHPQYTPRALVDMARTGAVIRRLGRRVEADLVHANSIRAGMTAVLAGRFGGAPVVVHLHDRLPPQSLSRAALGLIGAGATGVLGCSEYVLKQLPPTHRLRITRVVYNAVDTQRFDPSLMSRAEARERLGLAASEFVLAIVGHIAPPKGQEDAVKILVGLRETRPDARLLIVGSPTFVSKATRYDNLAYAESVKQLISSLGLDEQVLWLGERDDVPEILKAVDVFIAPSWGEGFGLSIVEAMAMELPVVATNVGGTGEFIGPDTGVLLPPHNPDLWVKEIERLIADPARRAEIGIRAREHVAQQLDASLFVERVMDGYRDALEIAEPRRRRPPTGDRAPAPKKVLFVNHTSQVSGGERSLLTLLGGLNGEIDATVACPDGRLSEEVRRLGLETVSIHGTEGSLKLHPLLTPIAMLALARSARQIKRVGRALGVDVVHANSIRAGISASLAARLGGPPAVVHVRDRLPAGAVSGITLRLLTEGAAAIVSNSRYTADGFETAGVHADVRVVHNPVDLERFDPDRITVDDARARLGLAPEAPVLGVLAQITPWKAQDDAIRIAANLRPEHPDIRLLLVGSAKFVSKATRFDNPRYLRELEELTGALGVTDNVMFLGEREDVPEVLRALDIVLVPSWEEPFGRAIIEAMAMCVPVLATSVGGPPEIISDGEEGLLLPPRRPDVWAEAVRQLLAEPELRAEMGRKGRALAASTFRLERHIDEVLALYRGLELPRAQTPALV